LHFYVDRILRYATTEGALVEKRSTPINNHFSNLPLQAEILIKKSKVFPNYQAPEKY
jgi:hypothetical protein